MANQFGGFCLGCHSLGNGFRILQNFLQKLFEDEEKESEYVAVDVNSSLSPWSASIIDKPVDNKKFCGELYNYSKSTVKSTEVTEEEEAKREVTLDSESSFDSEENSNEANSESVDENNYNAAKEDNSFSTVNLE